MQPVTLPSLQPRRPPIKSSKLTPLLHPLNAFLAAETAGGIALMAATVVAIAWANSPWGDSYRHLWHVKLAVGLGGRSLSMSLEHWVNDGLMAVFFLLVGLEIKREVLIGELGSVQRAALPVAAAIGGMVAPAIIYFALNHGAAGAAGWAIPMATDIAFAVGVLALAGPAVPKSIKVFLLAVAIVDDLGAVLVIAVFYTSHVSVTALLCAGVVLLGLIALNALGVHRPWPYLLLGVALWGATLASGLHATIAGVALALAIPATRRIEEEPFVDYAREVLAGFEREARAMPEQLTHDQSHAIKAMEEAACAVQTPLARVEHALLTPVSFLIIPTFALANAGVDLRGGVKAAATSPIAWGVFLGLLVGKPLGILGACAIPLKMRATTMPEGATVRHLIGASYLCGIGFTMSLFIGGLAFPEQDAPMAATKLGILAASLLSGCVGGLALAARRRDGPGDR